MRHALAVACTALLTACSSTPSPAPTVVHAVTVPSVMLSHLHALARPTNEARGVALLAMLEAHDFEPVLHEFPNDSDHDTGRKTGTNIEITVGDGAREIIVGAHYDAVRLADGSLAEGMVDNGASVIALVHVAELLRELGTEHKVRFVFFDMEELGLVGSRHFAASVDPERVIAMINLDVNAYGDTVFYGATANGHAPLYTALRDTCASLDRDCIGFDHYPPTDNISFQRAGIANISLSVAPRADVHQLWLLMNDGAALREGFLPDVIKRIHSPADRFEAVEPAAIVAACDTLAGLVLAIDRAPPQ